MQSYKSHTRYDPAMHFFLIPFGMLLLIGAIALAVVQRTPVSFLVAGLALASAFRTYKVRTYATYTQDRIVRLEENVRLRRLGVDPDRLTVKQLIALRFAPDNEVTELAARASRESLSADQIMRDIKVWRPDEHRV